MNERDYTEGEYLAGGSMKLLPRVKITTLYVYCNILEHFIVGNITAPLLHIVVVKINPKQSRMHKIMRTPLFVPVQKRSFDTTEIFIMTDEVKPVPFCTGKSHIVLVVRQFDIKMSVQSTLTSFQSST